MKIYTGENTVLKGNIFFSDNISVWHNSVIRADSDTVTIGEGTNIQDLCMIHTGTGGFPVTIGRNVTIGHHALIHGCTIGDNTLVGMGSIIMNGAEIGNNCIIGAGSLITQGKKFPENVMIMGSPARVIRELTAEEIHTNTLSAQGYVEAAKAELREIEVK